MSSITEALSKNRPDLTKQKRFERRDETAGLRRAPEPDLHAPRHYAPVSAPPVRQSAPFPAGPSSADVAVDAPFAAAAGWFGVPWLVTGRSKVLAAALGATALAVTAAIFPLITDVAARRRPEPKVAQATGVTVTAAAHAEIDRMVAAKALPPTPEPRLSLNPVRPLVEPTPPPAAPTPPPLTVVMHTRGADQLVADAALSGAAPAAPGEDRIIDVADVPLPTAFPSAEEVLYEGLPEIAMKTGAKPAESAPSDKLPKGVRTVDEKSSSKASSPASSGPKLSGIFWDETNPMAMLNGEILEVGQSVAGIKVLEIKPASITVEENGLRRSIGL